MTQNDRVLVISDLHAPYTHQDTDWFLFELNEKHKFTRIVLSGDEADKHAISFHDHDPDLPSDGYELEQAIECLQPIYEMFPQADVLDSNHGSLGYRRAKASGLSARRLRPYREVLEAPEGWSWHHDLLIPCWGRRVYFHHGLCADVAKAVKQRGLSVVQGHYHTRFEIHYVANPDGYLFGMTVGCLIDDKSRAMSYNKLQLARPVIGCGGILYGEPVLFPMNLTQDGRWDGSVP
jgi:hypothetical protein